MPNIRIKVLTWVGRRIGKPPGWERIVRLFASPEKCASLSEICLVRDGLLFPARPGMPLEWNVILFGAYEPKIREIFRAVVPLGGVVFDVGANVGYHSLLLAQLVGAGGQVVAAEPNADVRNRLVANLHLNRITHVEVLPFAFGDSDGVVEFVAPTVNDPNSASGHVRSDSGLNLSARNTCKVDVRRLDTIVATAGLGKIDLIKIDVEGFEWPVLQGAKKTIATFRPFIVFEFNKEYTERGRGNAKVMEQFFRTQRYCLYEIRRNWVVAIEPNNWPDSADIFAVPQP